MVTVEWVNRRQRQLLVHSFLYYQMNENMISDTTFDLWSKELYDAMQNYPDIVSQSEFYEGFKEFDGSSGFDLPYGDPAIQARAIHLLNYHKRLQKLQLD